MTTDRVARRALLRSTLRAQRRRVLAAAALFSSHQACEALVPVLIGVIVDRAVDPGAGTERAGADELVLWIAVLGVVFATLSMSYRFGERVSQAAAEWSAHDLRLRIAERVLHPRGGAEAGRLPGDLANVATSDAQRVGVVTAALPTAIAAVTAILVGGVAVLRLSLPVGLLVLLGGPVLLGLVHLLGRPLEHRSEIEQEQAANASGVAADLVTGLRVLKGIGAEDAAVARYREVSERSLAATLRSARAQAGYDGTMLAMSGLFLALVALVAGREALAGRMSVGDLVAAVGLAQFLLGPIMVVGWVSAEFAQARASAARVAAVLDAPHAVPDGDRVPAGAAGRVAFRGLRHEGLDGLDLDVSPGELVGVVSGDPAHGRALLRCLGREADPEAGDVELDGVPLRALDPRELRAAVVVAAHDAELFGGTLLENAGGSGSAPEPAIERALAASAADEVARTMPDGLAGVVAERGGNLSGGQRQRVALARALGTEAPVLVLHDPTTAVDTVTEARIAAGLRELRRGRTTIVVTTGPALLAVADRVVLLERGRVSAEGTHRELVREHAGYRAAVLA